MNSEDLQPVVESMLGGDDDARWDDPDVCRKGWQLLVEAGFTRLGLPESLGGSGGSLLDAATVIRIAARLGAPFPLADSMVIGQWLLAEAGTAIDGDCVVVGRSVEDPLAAGRYATCAVIVGDGELQVFRIDATPAGRGGDSAEPLERLVDLRDARQVAARETKVTWNEVEARGALARSVQIVGALEAVESLTLRHALERRQFGQPLLRFQAIQHHIAKLAGEVAAARAAVLAALTLCEAGSPHSGTAMACAKSGASTAATRVAGHAHQVHGAIGFTREHPLHRHTARLWKWREEYGNEFCWSEHLSNVLAGDDHEPVANLLDVMPLPLPT